MKACMRFWAVGKPLVADKISRTNTVESREVDVLSRTNNSPKP
jgi:hypothetical protein